MATRFASEKGIEVLLDALPRILETNPRTRVLFAGQHEAVWAEEDYRDRLMPRIRDLEARGLWEFLGTLSPKGMAAFYPSLDVLVVPSLNSTESFGLVQIEAMMNGVPVVASDLPGVRQPIAITGMGRVVAVGNAPGLAAAVLDLFAAPAARMSAADLTARFSPERTAEEYEAVFAHARGVPETGLQRLPRGGSG